MITYGRYTEPLSKIIRRTITAQEKAIVTEYETGRPKLCPKCRSEMMTLSTPYRVAPDVDKCAGKAGGRNA